MAQRCVDTTAHANLCEFMTDFMVSYALNICCMVSEASVLALINKIGQFTPANYKCNFVKISNLLFAPVSTAITMNWAKQTNL